MDPLTLVRVMYSEVELLKIQKDLQTQLAAKNARYTGRETDIGNKELLSSHLLGFSGREDEPHTPEQEDMEYALKERTFLLFRYIEGVEEPISDDRREVSDLLKYYRDLVGKRLKKSLRTLPMNSFTGTTNSILIHFFPEFPDTELPYAGGITSFEFEGSEYRFEIDAALAVATLSIADHLHHFQFCKPNLCPNPDCVHYSAALDEHLFMMPTTTYFMRFAPKSVTSADAEESAATLSYSDAVYVRNPEGNMDVLKLQRAIPLRPGEYLAELEIPLLMSHSHGDVHQTSKIMYEVMPMPSDASHLDMHLARLSAIDSRYVLRFTAEVKRMFEDTTAASGLEERERIKNGELELDESDDEESYVESSLVPGLQQRDFNRNVNTRPALAALKLDSEHEERLRELLFPPKKAATVVRV